MCILCVACDRKNVYFVCDL
uniref:Uncharacterized protein n=1 Tax=Arundo donax TaxID=35708 RepID=A0A0A8YXC1_ARUDO